MNRTCYLLTGAIVASAILFAGCKSGAAQPPAPQPQPTPAPGVSEPQPPRFGGGINSVPPVPTNVGNNSGAEAPKTPTPPVVNPANLSDARGLLKQAAENSLNTKSVSSEIEINVNVEEMGISFPVTLNIAKYDNLTHINSEFMNRPVDGYSDGKTLVMMDPMTKRWMCMPPEQRDMLLVLLEQVRRKIYIEHINSASFSNDEKIQDKNYQVIEATIKPEASNEILATQNNPMLQGLSIKIDKSSLKVWVEKDTCLIFKAVLNIESTLAGAIPGMPGNDIEDEEEAAESKTPSAKPDDQKPDAPKTTKIKYEIEINNSDYNKVPPIVIPDEVKKLLETPAAIEPTNK